MRALQIRECCGDNAVRTASIRCEYRLFQRNFVTGGKPYGRRYKYPCDCNSAMRTTPPLLAATKPGSRSFTVTCCDFMVLPQAAISRPALENWPTRLVTSGLAEAAWNAFSA